MKKMSQTLPRISILFVIVVAGIGCGGAATDTLFDAIDGGTPVTDTPDSPSTPALPSTTILDSFLDFEGTPSATTIVDSSGNGLDATLNNMTLANWVNDPEMGQVLSFESASQTTADLGNDLSSDDNFSVSLWVKGDGATITGPQHIFWQGASGINGWGAGTTFNANNHEFHISYNYFNACATGITVYFGGTDPLDGGDCSDRSDNAMVVDSTTVISDEWVHIAAVVTGANTATVTVKLYVNGSLVGTDTGTEVDRSSWVGNAKLGGPGASARFLDGDLSVFRVYNEELTDSEVLALSLEK